MFRNEQLVHHIFEESKPGLACVSVNERDEEIGNVHDEARSRETYEKNTGNKHWRADLGFATLTPTVQVVSTYAEEADEDPYTVRTNSVCQREGFEPRGSSHTV